MKMCDIYIFKDQIQIDSIRVSEGSLYSELSNYIHYKLREIIEAEKLSATSGYDSLNVKLEFSITIQLKD